MVEQRGFTIVELIMVIVIIGILAAVVGPRFFSKSNFDERFYFEEVLSSVRYAQKLAVASGCYIQVQVSATGTELHYFNNCGDKNSGETVLGGYAVANPQQVIKVGAAPFTVVFNSIGCVSTTKFCPVQGIDELEIGESSFKMKIHRATGFIEVMQ
ncbi:pilus assembly FimT family protein [Stutzerimonas stutzeri]|uniref:General secretion pathway protein H n=1 Tax=Stutzerimonas stutzeri KOS6 TaxID=1218352 RepID=A0A061JVU8_STUST|nr:prepilin-type N-terminal cleavage/methylation domain-containing protein [Stutzerimonas stutzeri]EWC42765.1 general secretion pathway protein H [Stutzerimonas stutzeri KOS6]